MILETIKDHFENKNYVKITRAIGGGDTTTSSGYIVKYSPDFLILQETGDFNLSGYAIVSIPHIVKIRFNRPDQYYNKIMAWEGQVEKVGINDNIDLNDWASIFKSIKKTGLNVIVECEGYDTNTFNIGPIIKTTKSQVFIHYFDATGFWEEEPTSIDLKNITRVNFDDRYINIFSKYLRHRRVKKQE